MNRFSDLEFLSALVRLGSQSNLARELCLTPAAVSKRLAQIEHRLGVRLLQRSTRQMNLTPEGECYLAEGQGLLTALADLENRISAAGAEPQGLLRMNASYGFGRLVLAPAIAEFGLHYPKIDVQLHLTDQPVNLTDHGFDCGVLFGPPPDSRLIAKKILRNERVLCAAPEYLVKHGTPRHPQELAHHNCLIIRENDNFGTWSFTRDHEHCTLKISGSLSSNDGEVVTQWGLAGRGIILRSLWHIRPYLTDGALQPILPDWETPPADIHLIYPDHLRSSPRIQAWDKFLTQWLMH